MNMFCRRDTYILNGFASLTHNDQAGAFSAPCPSFVPSDGRLAGGYFVGSKIGIGDDGECTDCILDIW